MDAEKRVFDIHMHVVYGVDDGAANVEMAMDMLRQAYRQGVRDIICTSHSGIDRQRYDRHLAELIRRVKAEGLEIRLYPGCEIACADWCLPQVIAGIEDGTYQTLNGTEYVLLEFAPYASGEEILRCVKRVMDDTGKRIVIAHVERYYGLQEDKDCVDRLQELGCLLQINAYSLAEESNPLIKGFARQLLAEKRVTFLGSDAHRSSHRPPAVATGVEYVYGNCEAEYAEEVCWRNGEKMMRGR